MATWFRMGTLPLASRPMENISGRPRLRYANVHAPLLISLFKMKLASDPKCAVVNGTFSGGVSPTKCKVECIGRTKFLTGDDHGIVCESGGVWARGGTACVKPPEACRVSKLGYDNISLKFEWSWDYLLSRLKFVPDA
eukprot:991458_1